ncbi:MAG: hypothetical protein GY842_26035, partial [bacterium]|nr:hypothetical protein [bacterium]
PTAYSKSPVICLKTTAIRPDQKEPHPNDFPYPEHLTKAFLRKGKLMLFVDGLDEAPARHRVVLSEGLEYVKSRFPGNRLIIGYNIEIEKSGD